MNFPYITSFAALASSSAFIYFQRRPFYLSLSRTIPYVGDESLSLLGLFFFKAYVIYTRDEKVKSFLDVPHTHTRIPAVIILERNFKEFAREYIICIRV